MLADFESPHPRLWERLLHWLAFVIRYFFPFLFFFSFGLSPALCGMLANAIFFNLSLDELNFVRYSARLPFVSATASAWGQRPAVLVNFLHWHEIVPLLMETLVLLPCSVTQYTPALRSMTEWWESMISASFQIWLSNPGGTVVMEESTMDIDIAWFKVTVYNISGMKEFNSFSDIDRCLWKNWQKMFECSDGFKSIEAV